MYSYYCLSALGPAMAKYLWWKQYLTLLQIVQFVLILLYLFVEFLNGCVKLNNTEIALAAHVSFMLFLFLDFYKKYKNNDKLNGNINNSEKKK
ncbi:hypothetical protein AVEN_249757-1 [Araneus ventricosus]|uniref:Elongation of very long chain fatty acids protein n=1 Tax=Araneus ventricosus TaxID=182803 RepID=A0A4Y2C5H5_ARAVE|nr:hypothetical protein AVEN_249757-1 [Araneus ventricosus]